MSRRSDMIAEIAGADVEAFLDPHVPDLTMQEEIDAIIKATDYNNLQEGQDIWFTITGTAVDESAHGVGQTFRVAHQGKVLLDLYVLDRIAFDGKQYLKAQVVMITPEETENLWIEEASPYRYINKHPMPETKWLQLLEKPVREVQKPWINQGRSKKGGKRKY